MRSKFLAIIAGLGIAALVVAAVAAIQIGTTDANAQGGSANRGEGTSGTSVHVEPNAGTPLTADEAADLQYMREEEKLAQDVYELLGAKYDARVFANIARSETQHTATVKTFLDAFKVADPAAGRAAGSYANGDLQALYDQLVAQGGESLADAVNVGIAIEERDIADLKSRIAATDRADLKAMYGNLLRASENHLRAFTRQLDGSGGTGGSRWRPGPGPGSWAAATVAARCRARAAARAAAKATARAIASTDARHPPQAESVIRTSAGGGTSLPRRSSFTHTISAGRPGHRVE